MYQIFLSMFTQHPSVRELASFMKELCDLVQETSQAFQPFPSVERELINLEEEIRHCQLPFEEKNVRGREWEVRRESKEGRRGREV